MPSRRNYILAALTVLLGAIMFSSKAIFVKLAYQYNIDPISLLTLRMTIAFPIFLAVGFWASRQSNLKNQKLTSTEWRGTIVMGMFGYYIASLLDFKGLQYITASFERIILYLYPTLVLIFSALFFKFKIRKIHLVALCLTYLGVGIAFSENLNLEENVNLIKGSSLVFAAAIFYAVYLVGSDRLISKVGTFRYNSISMSAACLAVFIHSAFENGFDIFNFETPVYWLTLYLALFATVIPSFLMAEGIRVIGSGNASIIGSIGPISTIVMAYFILGERLGWFQWLGTLFVIAGVLLITLKKNKTQA